MHSQNLAKPLKENKGNRVFPPPPLHHSGLNFKPLLENWSENTQISHELDPCALSTPRNPGWETLAYSNTLPFLDPCWGSEWWGRPWAPSRRWVVRRETPWSSDASHLWEELRARVTDWKMSKLKHVSTVEIQAPNTDLQTFLIISFYTVWL